MTTERDARCPLPRALPARRGSSSWRGSSRPPDARDRVLQRRLVHARRARKRWPLRAGVVGPLRLHSPDRRRDPDRHPRRVAPVVDRAVAPDSSDAPALERAAGARRAGLRRLRDRVAPALARLVGRAPRARRGALPAAPPGAMGRSAASCSSRLVPAHAMAYGWISSPTCSSRRSWRSRASSPTFPGAKSGGRPGAGSRRSGSWWAGGRRSGARRDHVVLRTKQPGPTAARRTEGARAISGALRSPSRSRTSRSIRSSAGSCRRAARMSRC